MKKIINWIKDFMEGCRRRRAARLLRRAKDAAEHIFQVEVYDGQLWLTYNEALVLPFSLVTKESRTEECLALLNLLREYYVQRAMKAWNVQPGEVVE